MKSVLSKLQVFFLCCSSGEIKVCPKLGPGLAIAVALIGLCVAGFDIYMLLSKEKPIKGTFWE